MAPSAGFWKGFKRTLLVLIALCLIGSVLFFVLLPGAKGLLFGGCTLILVVNLALMLIFVRANDQKRPGTRNRDREPKRFDFHRDR